MDFVVRCTSCRQASAVEAEGRGQTVRCPHCAFIFVAVPEVPVAPAEESPAPHRPRNGDRSPRDPERLSRNQDRPPRRRRRQEDNGEERPSRTSVEDHDPHGRTDRGVSASVLVGLALLPFVIPILWITAPALFGQPPAVSIAVPAALAATASILSLAVIYTIDWTPTVRVKGVLMIVGLSYLLAVSFFFLKQDQVAWLKQQFWKDDWKMFHPQSGGYSVKLPPGTPAKDNVQPIRGANMECYSLHTEVSGETYAFVMGASKVDQPKRGVPAAKAQPKPGSEEWFNEAMGQMAKDAAGEVDEELTRQAAPPLGEQANGREFVIKLNGDVRRVVRLYVIRDRVIYLSVEATDLTPENPIADKFFRHLYMNGM